MSKPKIFTPISVGPVEFENRIVVAPMCQYSAENGLISDWHRMHVMQYAISGASLFMLEATGVSLDGRITTGCVALTSDDHEKGLAQINASCRRYGAKRLGIQLNHSGRKGSSTPPWASGKPLPLSEGGWLTRAPSELSLGEGWPIPQAFTEAELKSLIDAYVDATKRSAKAGFDVLEVHAAHGYLLHQFLSPVSNQRSDRFGGTKSARMVFPLEVVSAVRNAWPKDRVLGIRVSATDWIPDGLQPADVIEFLNQCKEIGVDYVCVSSGGIRPDIRIPVGLGYQVQLACDIRRATGLVTRAVGMILSPTQAEKILAEGYADQIAIGRGFLDDPRWVWHAAAELGVDLPYPPQYERATPRLWPGYGKV